MNYYLEGYGELEGVTLIEKYDSGELEYFKVEEINRIIINDMCYIPRYTIDDERKKEYSAIKLYKSGKIKSLDLEKKTKVSVAAGVFYVEKVVFYESGELRRLFPLNGRINGYWSEDDEYSLAEEYSFNFKFSEFKAKVISIQLFKNENIKSITLWPKEKIKIKHNDKVINVRTGFSAYEDGSLKTCEPDNPVKIYTPIGEIEAYDKNSIGIHGENNSLKFNKDGSVSALTTSSNIIKIINRKGQAMIYSPKEIFLYANSEVKDLITVTLQFTDNEVIINGSYKYKIKENSFIIEQFGEKKLTLTGDKLMK